MDSINTTGKKIICSIIATLIAICLALTISGIVASGVIKNQEFVANRLTKCNSILLDELNKKTEEIIPKYSNFPVKAFTDSVGEGHIKTVLLRASGNLVYGFKTDFSDSSYLYGYYKTGLTGYCKRNNIPIDQNMENTINRDASLAVDVFNQVCEDESTNFVIPFQRAQSSDSIKVTIISALLITAFYYLLKRINYGDYFMFSYIGMSIVIAGAIMIFLPLFALAMDYSSLFNFTDVDAYNVGIKYCIEDTLKVLSITGVVVTIVGIVTMNVVFNRYRNIVFAIQTEMDIAEKLRKEYMEEQMQFEMEQARINETQDDKPKPTVKDDYKEKGKVDLSLLNRDNLIDVDRNYHKNKHKK